jgi:hypothetical protein
VSRADSATIDHTPSPTRTAPTTHPVTAPPIRPPRQPLVQCATNAHNTGSGENVNVYVSAVDDVRV